jgi:phosphotransferase system enzyme I (PtsI)
VAAGTEAIVSATGPGGQLVVRPTRSRVDAFEALQRQREHQRIHSQRYLARSARTADGVTVKVYVNVDDPLLLGELDPAHCDGIGLTRTEFLFHGDGLPDEETQYRVYRDLVRWASGRPVTIRTLDAGGDKPIPGLTVDGEQNPFLGLRGVRLSLARREIFEVQLRALARAAVLGTLKVMVPMVTVPEELERVRALLREQVQALRGAGVEAAVPSLGMMVEVPAAALNISAFSADFLSIGTNDLVQYLMAAGRDNSAVAHLQDCSHPAVLELISRVVSHGADADCEVSVCGEMAAMPDALPALLESGIKVLSVPPAVLAEVKAFLASHQALSPREAG